MSAEVRLLSGSVEVDLRPLAGESIPVLIRVDAGSTAGPLIEAPDIAFGGLHRLGM